MWPDPTVRKKPVYLGGTPANKASFLFVGIGTGLIIGCCTLLSYTQYFQKRQEKHLQESIKQIENRDAKLMMMDPLVSSAVLRKLNEHNRIPDRVIE